MSLPTGFGTFALLGEAVDLWGRCPACEVNPWLGQGCMLGRAARCGQSSLHVQGELHLAGQTQLAAQRGL